MSTQVKVGPVEIVCGANHQVLELGEDEHLTVGDVRTRLADVMNIAPSALAVIGDTTIPDDRVLTPGETLQFIRQSGTKG